MGLSNGDLSAADVAAVMNGGNRGGFGDFGDGSFWILVLFLFALGGNWGNGGFGGGNGVQQGFDQASIMNSLNGINASLCNGFAGAEASANARQIADMQNIFALQTAMNQGFNGVNSQFANCCCENRLATASLSADIARESCASRQAVADGVQKIIDQMCQDKIDAKNETIANLRQQMNLMQLNASQNAQTQALIANNDLQTAALEQYLAPVPRPAYIVQNPNCCQQSYYNGCGSF